MEAATGPWAYFPFVILGTGTTIFFYKCMPETKGKPVDEIVGQWVDPESDFLLSENKNCGKYYSTVN